MTKRLAGGEKSAMGREFAVDRQSHARVLTLSRRGCNEWLRAILPSNEASRFRSANFGKLIAVVEGRVCDIPQELMQGTESAARATAHAIALFRFVNAHGTRLRYCIRH